MIEFFKVVDSDKVEISGKNAMCFGRGKDGKNYSIIKSQEHTDDSKSDAERVCELLNLFHNGRIKFIF